MKRLFQLLFLITCLFALSSGCMAAKTPSPRINSKQTLLDLYYGMADWYDQKDTYTDSVLDNVVGLKHYELKTDWSDGTYQFVISVGLYIDENFPTNPIKRDIFSRIDSIICKGLEYDMGKVAPLNLSQMENTNKVVDRIQNFFIDKTAYINIPDKSLMFGSRVCVVAHQVAATDKWVTYIIESTYDFHLSCGCNSAADYITYDIETGAVLSLDDLLKIKPVAGLETKLLNAFEKAAADRGFPREDVTTGKTLINDASGAAIINEGLLIYFKPYEIGCGAEGQYNLIFN